MGQLAIIYLKYIVIFSETLINESNTYKYSLSDTLRWVWNLTKKAKILPEQQ